MDDIENSWRSPRRLMIYGVTLALLVAAGLAARPTYRAVKRWRAQRFAAEGQALLKEGKLESAVRKAQQALQLSQTEPHSLQLMAQALTTAGHEQAMHFWKELLKTGKATAADRNQMIGHAIRSRDWATAREQLLVALKDYPAPETYRIAADYYAAQGDFTQGITFARKAQQAAPADTTNTLFLAQRLMLPRTAAETSEAGKLLRDLAISKEPPALDAIALLASRFSPTVSEANQYVRLIQEHPARGLPHEFFALDLALQFNPKDREQLIEGAMKKFGGLGNEGLVQLGRWLSRNREYDRLLKAIPLSRATENQDLFLLHADALAAQNRWSEIDAALNNPHVPLDPFFISIYQVRTAIELKRTELVAVNWALAQRRAADNASQLNYLVQYAEKIGAREEAIKACRRLTEIAPGDRNAHINLVRLLERVGQTREIRDALGQMLQHFPEEVSARNDHAYLNLLLGEHVEAAAQASEQLTKATPNMLAYRITLALACLRLNQAGTGKALLSNVKVDWNQVAPGWRSVYAAVLAANGDVDAARQVARQIPPEGLKPEERALIQKLL